MGRGCSQTICMWISLLQMFALTGSHTEAPCFLMVAPFNEMERFCIRSSILKYGCFRKCSYIIPGCILLIALFTETIQRFSGGVFSVCNTVINWWLVKTCEIRPLQSSRILGGIFGCLDFENMQILTFSKQCYSFFKLRLCKTISLKASE